MAEFDPKYVEKIIEMSNLELKTDLGTRQSKAVATFNCPPLNPSNPKPTNVHQLRPSDVEVVAAIGDSLTVWIYLFIFLFEKCFILLFYKAANGAKARSILGLIDENRGVSWSIGSEIPEVSMSITLPSTTI